VIDINISKNAALAIKNVGQRKLFIGHSIVNGNCFIQFYSGDTRFRLHYQDAYNYILNTKFTPKQE
jgi:hypothetical protein